MWLGGQAFAPVDGKNGILYNCPIEFEELEKEEWLIGIPCLILGESGSGKSASLRNFNQGEVAIINVSKKPLPFKTKIKTYNSDDYVKIDEAIRGAVKKGIKAIVIDDAQYLQANEYMRKANINGYQKFTEISLNLWSLFQMVKDDLPEDVVVYFMAHVERDADGRERFKTVGS